MILEENREIEKADEQKIDMNDCFEEENDDKEIIQKKV